MTTDKEVYDNFLVHYGVKGMRWGVRRERPNINVPRAQIDKMNADLDRHLRKQASNPTSREVYEKGRAAIIRKHIKDPKVADQMVKRYVGRSRKNEVKRFISTLKNTQLTTAQKRAIAVGAGISGAAAVATMLAGPIGGISITAAGRALAGSFETTRIDRSGDALLVGLDDRKFPVGSSVLTIKK